MKRNTRYPILAAILAIALILPIVSLHAQVLPTTYGYFTVATNLTLTNAQTYTVNSAGVDVRQGRGLVIMPYFAGTDTTSADCVFKFALSADGTNYTTTTPLSFTNSLNSATAVRGYYFFTPLQLDNVYKIRLTSIQNAHTNSIVVTNVLWSVRQNIGTTFY